MSSFFFFLVARVEAVALAPPARMERTDRLILVMRPTREIGGGGVARRRRAAALLRCSGARTATPCRQAFQRVFVVAESDWVGARASSWVRWKALVAYITATATEKGRASQRFSANWRQTKVLAS